MKLQFLDCGFCGANLPIPDPTPENIKNLVFYICKQCRTHMQYSLFCFGAIQHHGMGMDDLCVWIGSGNNAEQIAQIIKAEFAYHEGIEKPITLDRLYLAKIHPHIAEKEILCLEDLFNYGCPNLLDKMKVE